MSGRRLRVFQHLTLHAVHHDDTEVAAAVVDRHGRRHRLIFHFEEARVAADHAWSMRQWLERRTSLTYVRGHDGRSVLLDDERAFRQAFGGGWDVA